jgi:hypothetical protein
MDVPVAAHAHRKLRRLDRYVPASTIEADERANFLSKSPQGGDLVGFYRNDEKEYRNRIVFYSNGLSVDRDGIWQYVSYSDITKVIRAESHNVEEDEVSLEIGWKSILVLVIHGKDVGRGTHDKYDIMMFLDSVIAKNSVHGSA